jgi:hypothetical protein
MGRRLLAETLDGIDVHDVGDDELVDHCMRARCDRWRHTRVHFARMTAPIYSMPLDPG